MLSEVSYIEPPTLSGLNYLLELLNQLFCTLHLKVLSVLLHVSHGLVASVVGIPFLVWWDPTCFVAALLAHLVQSLHRSRRYLLRIREPKWMREREVLTLARCARLGPSWISYADAGSCLQWHPPKGKLPHHDRFSRSHLMKRKMRSGAT